MVPSHITLAQDGIIDGIGKTWSWTSQGEFSREGAVGRQGLKTRLAHALAGDRRSQPPVSGWRRGRALESRGFHAYKKSIELMALVMANEGPRGERNEKG